MLDGKKMNVAPQDLIAIKNYSNYLCEAVFGGFVSHAGLTNVCRGEKLSA